jgi:hypothetical protein
MAQRFETDGGTAFVGPLQVLTEDTEVILSLTGGATALPADADDQTGGTADTTGWELVAVGATDAADESGPINDNFATIAEILNRLLDRIQ